ncbi:hypothetical protein [Jidongwangia harbinensis]|uniref:hypothetical protein n=1 Tax=Jidongwangia harbinensis TaxID=2878561 RepID=UPI001CDA3E1C|nr:hypothetical protein [Jidongwangia harbinensis]MCA2212133.1 hypothetical protein [Jidongwangia harbinensis]
MRRSWPAALALLLAGCGIQPSGVDDAGRAATGVAPGVTLYFVDDDGRLQPQLRRINRLGTISEALALLLTGPGSSGLRTEITPSGPAPIVVDPRPGLIRLMTPLAEYEVTPLGIDQIVCTALGVWVQSGGAADTRVQVTFTLASPESERHRTCPRTG